MADTAQIPVFNLFGETTALPDVVHCEQIVDRAGLHGWRISPHRHTQMSQVFLIDQGHAQVMVDGSESTLDPGNYLYVPPQVVHGFDFAHGTEGVVLSFPAPVVAGLGPANAAIAEWLAASRQGAVSDDARARIATLERVYAGSGTFRTQRLVALAHDLLAMLAEESLAGAPSPRDPNRQMQALDALIAAHIGESWSARDYAAALHITTGHLNRIVRSVAGVGLTVYLETAVMAEACRLIAFTRLPIAEVGYRLGFSDPPYFSRRFRLRVRETPSAYRARVSGDAI
jgi:AraC family transcriptional activator of pobA